MERLDKLLCAQGLGSRKEVRQWLHDGRVLVNGEICIDPARKVDPAKETIQADDVFLSIQKEMYIMLNKPPGILTAAMDKRAKTVMDLLPPKYLSSGCMPVGRLDKDTRGLLLCTTDGALAHLLLSPKRHVWKEYQVTVQGRLTQADVDAFSEGIPLNDFTALPAQLTLYQCGEAFSKAVVRIREGKFHQVKRMFLQRGCPVTELRRLSFGSLRLDESLPEGSYRDLTAQEINALKSDVGGRE